MIIKVDGFFKTRKYHPPLVNELYSFEEDMIGILNIIQFKISKNAFQKELSVKVDEIKKNPKILIMGDKTKKHTP